MGVVDTRDQCRGATAEVAASDPALQRLQVELRGQLVRGGDPAYDSLRRVWNGSIDRRPAAIVQCTGVADVITAVRGARTSGLQIAVRSGGHSFPGLCVADGALWSISAP